MDAWMMQPQLTEVPRAEHKDLAFRKVLPQSLERRSRHNGVTEPIDPTN